ncbi:SLAM family member 7-like [Alosa alosa]|uniref:SLAM family member 7-like n=1 Tax=Alosa alosa TaxID=278164 RepID=UPI0020150EC7|nr:SLAM family member 7-like [Alosa alosa]
MEMHLSTLQFLVIYILQTAGSPESSVFRPTGGSITLEFQQHQQLEEIIEIIQWHFGLVKIMKYVPHKGTLIVFTHRDRVEFNKETFSLELKNLQKNESGLYRGEISTRETEVLAEIRLYVLDPVEAPVMSVVSNGSSSDSCNVTVICRGRDLSLTSTCNSSSCSPKEGASTDSTLTLSVRGVVLCNYSNPVSWKHATLRIKPLCSSDAKTPPITMIVIPAIKAIAIVFVAGAAIFVYRQRSRGGAAGTATGPTQTEYAEVTPSSALGFSDPGGSTYSTVQDTQPAAAEESPYDEICLHTLDVDTSSLDPLKNPSSNGGVVPQDPPQPDSCLYAKVRRT